MTLKSIKQGTNRAVRAYDIVDGEDDPLIVNGWTVVGVARKNHEEGVILSTWSTTPTGAQGLATAAGREVRLLVTPAQSNTWDCDRVSIQAEMTSPDGTQKERIIDRIYKVDRRAVTP